MGQNGRAGGRYIIPIDSNGATLEGTAAEGPGRGICTLTAGATYYYILGGAPAPFVGIQFTSYASAAAANGLIITSATIQDCNHMEQDVLDKDATIGNWVNEDPSTGFVGVDGTGWSVSNSVVAATGAGLGGAVFHIGETAAARTRLAVVVGATGGPLRVSGHGKD